MERRVREEEEDDGWVFDIASGPFVLLS